MAAVEKTQTDLALWRTDEKAAKRIELLRKLAEKAGIAEEFAQVPPMHIGFMEYDKFLITVQGFSKIAALREVTQALENDRL